MLKAAIKMVYPRDRGLPLASKASHDQKKPLKYCHAHGSQNTHTSSECKMMDADKARFSAAMRTAKDPENPPGGSTKVLGQSSQKQQ